jgi:hypothetical protein
MNCLLIKQNKGENKINKTGFTVVNQWTIHLLSDEKCTRIFSQSNTAILI